MLAPLALRFPAGAILMLLSGSHDKHWVTQVVRDALSSGSNTELLKALVEAFPGSWFFTRVDTTFAFVNQRACDSLGYTREELMALTLYDVDPGLTPAIWNALIDMGPFIPASVRTTHRRKDGSVFPVEAYGSRILLGDENVSVAYVVDISEEAQAREALAEKQYLLKSLLAQAPIFVWLVDTEGRIQVSEGRAESLQDFDPRTLVGRTISEIAPGYPELVLATEQALRGESVSGIVTVGASDFEYRYVPRRDSSGNAVGATGVAMDVSARHCAEQANRRLMAAIEQSEESVVLLSAEGRIEYVNSAFEKGCGVPRSDAVGMVWTDVLPNNADQEPDQFELPRAISAGCGWHGTLHGSRLDRIDFVDQVTLSPLRDTNARLTGFVAVSRDITEQVRTEERLRQVEKMDAIGQLAGGIAHDFNNLLQVILGNVNLCMVRDVPAPVMGMLKEIEQAGHRAASLVTQLLTFSRKRTGKQSNVSLGFLVNRLLPLIKRMVGEHILVELEAQDVPLAVWGDESQLEQIVINLCVNARDAMPEGGHLRLKLAVTEASHDEATSRGLSGPGNYVVLEVHDSGCGMTEEVSRRVFEPFFTTKDAGTGIGLATVYAVAKRHGGSVEVLTDLGRGSLFRVLLRQSTQKDNPQPQRLEPKDVSARKVGVLLVEDDTPVREVTQRFLEQAGHSVVVARDGLEAIAFIDARKAAFDLMVLDAIMPRVSGPEVYRRFRAYSSAPILIVTGHGFNALTSLPEDPARAILEKPFTASALASAVQELLSRGTPQH